MPTTIDSAGITFNDTTSLTSANIGTAQLVNGSVIASKLGTNEQKQIAKAWVNFNGTGTIGASQTMRSNFNVSSVTKNGTGDYTVNFTTAMADANYSWSIDNDSTGGTLINLYPTSVPTTSNFRIRSMGLGGGFADSTYISVIVFGN